MIELLSWIVEIRPGYFTLSAAHAILGAPLAIDVRLLPWRLWTLVRGEANWHIWKARCSMEMEHVDITRKGVQIRIWKELCLYIKMDWAELLKKVDLGRITLVEAKGRLSKDYGRLEALYTYDERRIWIPLMPSEGFIVH